MTCRAPVAGGGPPGEVDPRGAVGLRDQGSGRAGQGRLGGRARDVGERPGPGGVDRGDPIVPRACRPEVQVRERGDRRARVATDDPPGAARVVGGLDPVAEDRGAAGVAGRAPRKVNARGADLPGRQVERRAGHVGVRARPRLERPRAGAHAVDRRHLIPIGGGRLQAGVREGGRRRTRIGLNGNPRAVAGSERPDAVTGDARAAVAGRRVPGEGDAARPGPARTQVLRLPGGRGVGGALDDAGPVASALAVDRRHAVVPGGAGDEAGVLVGGGRARGDGHQSPARHAGGRHLDAVAGDRAPAVRGRTRPGEQEPGASPRGTRNRLQARGRVRSGDLGARAGDVRPGAPARPVDRRDAVVAGCAGAEIDVGVFGGSRIRVPLEHRPAAASGSGPLDAVAGDRG